MYDYVIVLKLGYKMCTTYKRIRLYSITYRHSSRHVFVGRGWEQLYLLNRKVRIVNYLVTL